VLSLAGRDLQPACRVFGRLNVQAVGAVGAKSAAEDLSLLKNLSDQRVGSSATATVGRARKFVRSRNPVTVIVKIESHNLEETRIWAPPQAVSEKGRISAKRPRDRLSS
jgi:hypothetical protein